MKEVIMKKLLLLLTLLVTPALQACIPEIEVWGDGPTMAESKHFRYLLKDRHIDYEDGRVSLTQQADIVWAAQVHKPEDVFVIGEDSQHYEGNNKKIASIVQKYGYSNIEDCLSFVQTKDKIKMADVQDSTKVMDSAFSPLFNLITRCQKAGLNCYNSECNQALILYTWDLPDNKKITEQDILDELATHIQKLANQPILKPCYDNLCKELVTLKKLAAEKKVLEFLTLADDPIRRTLVDAKIICKLIEWRHIKHGFVCAGTNHIERIKPYLSQLGYTKLKSVGKTNIWRAPSPNYVHLPKQERHNIEAVYLKHALDLRKEFTQIFAEQAEITAQKLAAQQQLEQRIQKVQSAIKVASAIGGTAAAYACIRRPQETTQRLLSAVTAIGCAGLFYKAQSLVEWLTTATPVHNSAPKSAAQAAAEAAARSSQEAAIPFHARYEGS
jgi:hypothetical protein